jgi:hypothetical protein
MTEPSGASNIACISFDVSIDETMRSSINDSVRAHLEQTFHIYTGGSVAFDDMVIDHRCTEKPYIYYYRHRSSGDLYMYDFVEAVWSKCGK